MSCLPNELPEEVKRRLEGALDLTTEEGWAAFEEEFWSPELIARFDEIDKEIAEGYVRVQYLPPFA